MLSSLEFTVFFHVSFTEVSGYCVHISLIGYKANVKPCKQIAQTTVIIFAAFKVQICNNSDSLSIASF